MGVGKCVLEVVAGRGRCKFTLRFGGLDSLKALDEGERHVLRWHRTPGLRKDGLIGA
jgi:hypothetical protein